MNAFNYVVTTRDRPDVVNNCINSLVTAHTSAFPECKAKCFIVDDSTSEASSGEMKKLLNLDSRTEILDIYILGSAFQKQLIDNIKIASNSYEKYIDETFRVLGQGNWDHAGSSNFARLFSYSYFSTDEKTLFLDDDIIFNSQFCNGHSININGANALTQLYNSISSDNWDISGTTYLGRTDLSVLEHIFFLLIQLKDHPEYINRSLELLAEFPESLPVHVTLSKQDDNPLLPKGPGEISGAVLAVKNSMLLSHGMISHYNEDWIWILLHGRKSKRIYKCDMPLLHCPPSQKKISFDFMVYQEIGEIVFESIVSAVDEAPQDAYCLDWLRNNYKISHLENAVTDEILDIDTLIKKSMIVLEEVEIDKSKKDFLRKQVLRSIDFVSDVKKRIRDVDLDYLFNEVHAYFLSAENWRAVLKTSKVLSSNLVNELEKNRIV